MVVAGKGKEFLFPSFFSIGIWNFCKRAGFKISVISNNLPAWAQLFILELPGDGGDGQEHPVRLRLHSEIRAHCFPAHNEQRPALENNNNNNNKRQIKPTPTVWSTADISLCSWVFYREVLAHLKLGLGYRVIILRAARVLCMPASWNKSRDLPVASLLSWWLFGSLIVLFFCLF